VRRSSVGRPEFNSRLGTPGRFFPLSFLALRMNGDEWMY
jgi:hypothetical protein